jgi:hypothetical protein
MALVTASPASFIRPAVGGIPPADCGPPSKAMTPLNRPGRLSGTQAQALTPAASKASRASPRGAASTLGTATTSGAPTPNWAGRSTARSGQPGGYVFPGADQAWTRGGLSSRTM